VILCVPYVKGLDFQFAEKSSAREKRTLALRTAVLSVLRARAPLQRVPINIDGVILRAALRQHSEGSPAKTLCERSPISPPTRTQLKSQTPPKHEPSNQRRTSRSSRRPSQLHASGPNRIPEHEARPRSRRTKPGNNSPRPLAPNPAKRRRPPGNSPLRRRRFEPQNSSVILREASASRSEADAQSKDPSPARQRPRRAFLRAHSFLVSRLGSLRRCCLKRHSRKGNWFRRRGRCRPCR
jgi:hypothetical protein